MKSKIICLVKSARAGGSTYAKNWLAKPCNEGYQKVVVNGDNIRLSLYNQRYCSQGEAFVHAIEEVMIRSLLKNDNQLILVDDTHTTINSIKKILHLDPDAEFIFLNTPKETCFARALATGQSDLIDKGVIDRHFDNLIKLSQYGLEKENHERNFGPEATPTLCFRGMFFEKPDEVYIMKAIEYIRKEVKGE